MNLGVLIVSRVVFVRRPGNLQHAPCPPESAFVALVVRMRTNQLATVIYENGSDFEMFPTCLSQRGVGGVGWRSLPLECTLQRFH